MPQVSRKPLSRDTQGRLFEVFFKSLAIISDPSDIQKFLFDLLSPIERTMLAKRLAIALLLAKGYSYEAIKDKIHVSQETIARVNLSLTYGGEGYKLIIQKILHDEKKHILENVADAAIAILPNSSLKGGLIRHRKTARKPKTKL